MMRITEGTSNNSEIWLLILLLNQSQEFGYESVVSLDFNHLYPG